MTPSRLSNVATTVKRANEASTEELSESVPQTIRVGETRYELRLCKPKELSDTERTTIWEILKDNMCALYQNSSMGWNVRKKKRELFATCSRFLLVLARDESDDPGPPLLAAYAMFRFLKGEVSELYCYELQVHKNFRRQGLGKDLMDRLYALAKQWSMQQVTLTVFKANKTALVFYRTAGFVPDKLSPEEEDPEDYYIMCRFV